MNAKNWKALFIHFLNHNLKLNENQATLVLDEIKTKYIKILFHKNDEELIKINDENNVLRNMLKIKNGSFYLDNDEIEIEPIKLKQIIFIEDNPITEN